MEKSWNCVFDFLWEPCKRNLYSCKPLDLLIVLYWGVAIDLNKQFCIMQIFDMTESVERYIL